MPDIAALQYRLWPLLAPFGWAYGRVMAMRARLYAKGAMPSWEPPAPCVSVGNIGWGGSGKTPLAGWLLSWAVERGLDPVLLTRGYRARPEKLPHRVHPQSMAEESGDEPLLLARQNPQALVLVDPVRSRAGKLAAETANPKLFVLDDGFQHLAVKRQVDLVMLRPDDLGRSWNRVIPAGPWREPEQALFRAHAFIIKSSSRRFKEAADLIRERLGRFGKPVFSMSLRPTGVRNLRSGEEKPDFSGRPYLLVTGVAEPGQVAVTAARMLGAGPTDHMAYGDHHLFTRRDVAAIQGRAARLGVKRVLCTAKDGVKLGPLASKEFWTLEVRPSFGPSMGAGGPFHEWWSDIYDAMRLAGGGPLHEPDASTRASARGFGDLYEAPPDPDPDSDFDMD